MTMPVESVNKPPGPPPDKLDRFRAEMPRIPGLHNARPDASKSANDANVTRLVQIGGLAAALLLVGVVFLWWIKRSSHGALESPTSETAAEAYTPPPTAAATEAPASDGPVVAATAEELAKPWSAKPFTFVRPLTHERLDAIVIRLP